MRPDPSYGGLAYVPGGEPQILPDEPGANALCAALSAEPLEDEADGRTHLFIGVEGELPSHVIPDIARGWHEPQFATAGTTELCAVHSQPHPVLLRFRHLALQTEQQPVVRILRIEDALFVHDQDVSPATQIEEVVPIG